VVVAFERNQSQQPEVNVHVTVYLWYWIGNFNVYCQVHYLTTIMDYVFTSNDWFIICDCELILLTVQYKILVGENFAGWICQINISSPKYFSYYQKLTETTQKFVLI